MPTHAKSKRPRKAPRSATLSADEFLPPRRGRRISTSLSQGANRSGRRSSIISLLEGDLKKPIEKLRRAELQRWLRVVGLLCDQLLLERALRDMPDRQRAIARSGQDSLANYRRPTNRSAVLETPSTKRRRGQKSFYTPDEQRLLLKLINEIKLRRKCSTSEAIRTLLRKNEELMAGSDLLSQMYQRLFRPSRGYDSVDLSVMKNRVHDAKQRRRIGSPRRKKSS